MAYHHDYILLSKLPELSTFASCLNILEKPVKETVYNPTVNLIWTFNTHEDTVRTEKIWHRRKGIHRVIHWEEENTLGWLDWQIVLISSKLLGSQKRLTKLNQHKSSEARQWNQHVPIGLVWRAHSTQTRKSLGSRALLNGKRWSQKRFYRYKQARYVRRLPSQRGIMSIFQYWKGVWICCGTFRLDVKM